MARQFGLSLAPWSVMGGGRYKKDEKPKREGTPFLKVDKNHENIMKGLDEITQELGATRQQSKGFNLVKSYTTTTTPS